MSSTTPSLMPNLRPPKSPKRFLPFATSPIPPIPSFPTLHKSSRSHAHTATQSHSPSQTSQSHTPSASFSSGSSFTTTSGLTGATVVRTPQEAAMGMKQPAPALVHASSSPSLALSARTSSRGANSHHARGDSYDRTASLRPPPLPLGSKTSSNSDSRLPGSVTVVKSASHSTLQDKKKPLTDLTPHIPLPLPLTSSSSSWSAGLTDLLTPSPLASTSSSKSHYTLSPALALGSPSETLPPPLRHAHRPSLSSRRSTVKPPPRSYLPPANPISEQPDLATPTEGFSAILLDVIARDLPSTAGNGQAINDKDNVLITLEFAYSLGTGHTNQPITLPLEILRRAGPSRLLDFVYENLPLSPSSRVHGGAAQQEQWKQGGGGSRSASGEWGEKRAPEMTDGESAEDSEMESGEEYEYGLDALLRDEYLKSIFIDSLPGDSELDDTPPGPATPSRLDSSTSNPDSNSNGKNENAKLKPAGWKRAQTRNQYIQLLNQFPSPLSSFTRPHPVAPLTSTSKTTYIDAEQGEQRKQHHQQQKHRHPYPYPYPSSTKEDIDIDIDTLDPFSPAFQAISPTLPLKVRRRAPPLELDRAAPPVPPEPSRLSFAHTQSSQTPQTPKTPRTPATSAGAPFSSSPSASASAGKSKKIGMQSHSQLHLRLLLLRDAAPWHRIAARLLRPEGRMDWDVRGVSGFVAVSISDAERERTRDECLWAGMGDLAHELGLEGRCAPSTLRERYEGQDWEDDKGRRTSMNGTLRPHPRNSTSTSTNAQTSTHTHTYTHSRGKSLQVREKSLVFKGGQGYI